MERVSAEIWGGKITLVFLPKHAPGGFLSSLKPIIGNGNTIQYERFNLSDASESDARPFESLIYEHFEIGKKDPVVLKRTPDIFGNIIFNQHTVFVFENLPVHLAPKFRDFIVEAGRHFSSLAPPMKPKLLVVLDPGEICPLTFTLEPGIEKILFERIVKGLDQILGVNFFLSDGSQTLSSFDENLICSIAQYDFYLTERLFSCGNILEDYDRVLKEYALERGWDEVKYRPIEELSDKELLSYWALGILDEFNNKNRYHSAFYAIQKRNKELDKRLWFSGVQTMLPLIEEFRDLFINSESVIFPFKFFNEKSGKLAEDKNEFEIGEIFHMVNTREITFKHLSFLERTTIVEFVSICRDIRNDLSHIKIPPANVINAFFKNMAKVEKILNGKFS